MAIPVWVNGQVLPASDVNAWFVPEVAIKTSNQSVSSSTTPVNDSQLFLPLAINASYDLDLRVFYDGNTTGNGDLTLQLTVPAGVTASLRIAGFNLSSAWQYGYRTIPITALAFPTIGTGSPLPFEIAGIITTSSTSGNIQFQFAQNTSNAVATRVLTGSTMKLVRIS